MPYQALAEFYDRFMAGADYPGLAAYVEKLLAMHGVGPGQLVLDLACGSGSLSVLLAGRGFEVIGVDGSAAMLAQAQEKARQAGVDILFLQQSMQRLDLYGTVRAAVCTMDSLNHITDLRVLQRAVARVALFLEPGGVFVFDVNTLFKHRQVLGNHTFVLEDEQALCLWQNAFVPPDRVQVTLDFFSRRPGGLYARQSEQFFERAYDEATLRAVLAGAGLQPVALYGERTLAPPQEECQRQFWVAAKPAAGPPDQDGGKV